MVFRELYNNTKDALTGAGTKIKEWRQERRKEREQKREKQEERKLQTDQEIRDYVDNIIKNNYNLHGVKFNLNDLIRDTKRQPIGSRNAFIFGVLTNLTGYQIQTTHKRKKGQESHNNDEQNKHTEGKEDDVTPEEIAQVQAACVDIAETTCATTESNRQISKERKESYETRKKRATERKILSESERAKAENIIESWKNTSDRTDCSGGSMKQLFLSQCYENAIKNYKHIDDLYKAWNEKRLKNIGSLYDIERLRIFALGEQDTSFSLNLLNGGNDFVDISRRLKEGVLARAPSAFPMVSATNVLTGIVQPTPQNLDNKHEKIKENLKLFSQYSRGELIGELLLSKSMNENDREGLQFLQIIASAQLRGTSLYSGETNGEWNAETQKFLEDLLVSEDFKKEPKYEDYRTAILRILATNHHFEGTDKLNIYSSLDEINRRNEEYWKDPEAFWKSRGLEGQREFHGIQNSDAFHSYNDGERQFLKEHMKGFNEKITKFLSIPKLQEGEIPDEECKAKREQIWKTIPLDQLRSLYENFSSNSEEQAKFENYLKENNLPDVTLDNAILRSSIINGNVSINPAANYCYERIWINLYDEIIGESGKALTYLSDKTGDTAFNIKNDVLKYFLKDIVIHPEKEEEGIFYFRDEKNPDTLYGFNPENGKIFQRENISIDSDGAINFLGGEDHLLKQINGFKDIVNLDIEDLIPDTNAEDSDDLKKQILKKIVSKISVENVVDTGDLSQGKVENENKKNVCRDRIVGDIKYLLNIEDSYLQKADGKKYTIFESLIHTFDYIDKEYQGDTVPLSKMKEFLDKVCSSAGQEAVLRPQLLENNFEDKKDSNLPQGLQNGEIKKGEQEMWKFYLLDSLIDPKTQTFDVDLIMELSDDIQITGALAERDFNTVLGTISQRKDLKKLEIDFKKESTLNIEATQLNLNNLKDEIWLSSHIQDIESVA